MAQFEVKHNLPYYGDDETCMDEILSFTAGSKDCSFYGAYDFSSQSFLIFFRPQPELHSIRIEYDGGESLADFESKLSYIIYDCFGEENVHLLEVSTDYSLMNKMNWESELD